MNLKANKISDREEPVNILDTFKNHKSVQRIKLANFHSYSTLNFSKVTESKVRKEILNLSTKKPTENGDIPAKILMILNWLKYHLYLKKNIVLKKKIIDRLAYYHTCQKSLKGFFINKLILS